MPCTAAEHDSPLTHAGNGATVAQPLHFKPATPSDDKLRSLVRPDRIHRSLYRDPAIFELEMERLWNRTWLYVGHESQIPQPGDFVTLVLAGKPVVLVRHRDGAVHVLFNRCGHRGAVVCNEDSGNTKLFRCLYHGWAFATDGALQGVPLRAGYKDCLDLKDPDLGMVQLPRVESYQGFVFASFSPEGVPLSEFLGPIRRHIDDLVALSPDGELLVTGGVHRYEFRGNWKHQLENLNDLYHPFFSHASTVREDGRQFKRRSGDEEGPQIGSGGKAGGANPSKAFDEIPLHAFAQGHSYCGSMPFSDKRSGADFERYRALLTERHGEQRTREILQPDWHNAIIYPNVVIQSAAQHIRVINPISVDRTEILVFPVLLKGAPDKINRDVVRYLNVSHSAASLIQTDDLEAFERIQTGLAADGFEWLVYARGIAQDTVQPDGSTTGHLATELPMRNQYRAWLDHLAPASAPATAPATTTPTAIQP